MNVPQFNLVLAALGDNNNWLLRLFRRSHTCLLGCAAIILILETGCATSKLWLETSCATSELWSEERFFPAEPAKLRLCESARSADILVQYEEEHSSSKHPKPRAYFLFANTNNISAGRRPIFAKVPSDDELKHIPTFASMPLNTNAIPSMGYFAVTITNQVEFTLYRNGMNAGHFQLPRYDAVPCSTTRVLCTPVAIGLDSVWVAAHAAH